MVQNIFEVLTPRETEVFILRNHEKLTIKETATRIGCSVSAVKEYSKRARNKILELEENDISVIEEIFNEETERMASAKTVKQVQFLAQCSRMRYEGNKERPDTEAERQMRYRTNIDKKVITRPMTKQEKLEMEARVVPVQKQERNVTRAYQQYHRYFEDAENLEEMAQLEIILRAAGVIYRTPYINKLNRKTGMQLRAQESGYQVIVVEPGEGKNVPPGSKFVETIKNDDGNPEYSLWLFPNQFVCKKPKQRRAMC